MGERVPEGEDYFRVADQQAGAEQQQQETPMANQEGRAGGEHKIRGLVEQLALASGGEQGYSAKPGLVRVGM